MKNKVILVGAINEGNMPTCGETMKNQLFVKRFNELFDKVITVDTRNWQKRPWVLVKLLWVLMVYGRRYDVILSACPISVNRTIYITNRAFKRVKVHYWVIGGNLHDCTASERVSLAELQKLRGVYVEGNMMKIELEKQGLQNVKVVPNFKPITYQPKLAPKPTNEPYRFVFLSRIHPSKGIKEIVEATKQLNEMGIQNKFTVDFYGKIEQGYEGEFNAAIAPLSNVSYRGFLNLMDNRGYEELSTYDVMLFPTYWDGEGFPGIVIDANMSGLPLIASDWSMNKEVVIEGKTGFIIPTHDSEALKEKMKLFIDGQIDLFGMKQDCVEYVQQFDFRSVLSVDLMNKLNLL